MQIIQLFGLAVALASTLAAAAPVEGGNNKVWSEKAAEKFIEGTVAAFAANFGKSLFSQSGTLVQRPFLKASKPKADTAEMGTSAVDTKDIVQIGGLAGMLTAGGNTQPTGMSVEQLQVVHKTELLRSAQIIQMKDTISASQKLESEKRLTIAERLKAAKELLQLCDGKDCTALKSFLAN